MPAPFELTDEQWSLVEDLFDPTGRRGRPATIPRRQMVEAILYVARTGCQWRYLPERYGRRNSVWAQFWRWRRSGVWTAAMDRLRREVRVQSGRDPEPSLVMIDAQVAKGRRAGPGFHTRGGHGGRTRGTKRAVLVDYLGLPVAATCTAADRNDVRIGAELLDTALPGLPRVSTVMGDRGFRGLAHRTASRHQVMFEVKYWDERPEGGFRPIRPLWRVEDSFARLGAWRRLSRCFEGSVASATAWLQVACVGVLFERLTAGP